MIQSKIISSLEKVFINDTPDKFKALEKISALKGERVSFQLICYDNPVLDEKPHVYIMHKVTLSGALSKYAKLRRVWQVPVTKPVSLEHDEHYISCEPGLYPDVLAPFTNGAFFNASSKMAVSIWVDLEFCEDMKEVGESELTLTVTNERDNILVSECKLTVDVIDAVLPEQKLLCTQWVSFNSLWRYYGVEPFGERFFEILENYIRVDSAVEWAQDNSKPVVAYKKTSRSAVEYINLTKEIMEYANR
jgi:hypothetical protein